MSDASFLNEDPDESDLAPARTSKRRRILWTAVGLLLLLGGLYAGAVYLFLNSELGPWAVNRRPLKFTMTWQSGAMWTPGQVTVRGLRLWGWTPRGEWRAEVAEAELSLDPFALLHRRLRLTDAVARNCSLEWRSFDADTKKNRSNHAEPGSRGSDRPPGKWDFRFDAVDIQDLRQVRVDANVLVAQNEPGRGFLSLEFRPRDAVSMPRVELQMAAGRVLIDDVDQGVLDLLRIEGRLDPLVPRDHPGTDWLRFMTAEVEARAEAWSLERSLGATARVLGSLPVAVGGLGSLDTDVTIHRGRLRRGSRLSLEGDQVDLDYLSYRGTGAGRLDMVVEDELRLDLRLQEFTVAERNLGDYVVGHGLKLQASSPNLDLTRPTPAARASVTLPASKIPDFGVYGQYLPKASPIRIDGGHGEIEARFDFAVEPGSLPTLKGKLELRGDAVDGHYKNKRLRGDLHLVTELGGSLDPDREWQHFTLTKTALSIDDVRDPSAPRTPPWWARLEIPEGHWVVGDRLEVSADLTAAVSDSRPLIALILEKRSIPGWVESFLAHRGVTVTSRLRLDDKLLVLRDLTLHGGKHLAADAELRFSEQGPAGLALVTWRRFALAAELGPEPGRRDIDWIGARKFYAEHEPKWEQWIDSEQ